MTVNKYNMRLSEIEENQMIFVDLDGVLADFDKGVKELSGKTMDFWTQQNQISTIWKALEDLDVQGQGFYEWISKMPDAQALWDHVKQHDPVVLTGIPRGTWAAPQKVNWVAEHFGSHVPVITCPSWKKAEHAMAYMGTNDLNKAILIDDQAKARGPWEMNGGTFIHHTSAMKSIQEMSTYHVA